VPVTDIKAGTHTAPDRVCLPNVIHQEILTMRVDLEKCIGCGFCAAGCPCGIWAMMENTPIA